MEVQVIVVIVARYRFEPDYVCAGCGRRFAHDDGHDYVACAGTRSTDDGIYAAGVLQAQ